MEAIHSRVLKTSKDISWFFLGGEGGEGSGGLYRQTY